MISQIREPLSKLAQPIIIFFAKMKIHPTVFTVIGLLLSIAAGVFLALDNFLAAFILLWFGGAMDFIDGGVARYNNLESQKGSFLDSVIDRISDIAVFGGIIFSSYVFALEGTIMVTATLVVSYIRAKGESIGIKGMATGLIERAERWMLLMLLLFISLIVPNSAFIGGTISNPIGYYITIFNGTYLISYFAIGYMILTALSVITVLQRFIYVSIKLTKAEAAQEVQVQK